MPLELSPGENVLYPAPYVPTEHHALVLTTKRVVQFAQQGAFPVAQFAVKDIDFIGRSSERPYLGAAIAAAALGLILFIVGAAKELPAVLFAGADKAAAQAAQPKEIEGRDKDDDYPFEDGSPRKKSLKDRAEDVKQLPKLSPGVPPITLDLVLATLLMLGGAALGYGAYKASQRQRYAIFCTVGKDVHRIDVADATQQNTLLLVLQSVHRPK